jgi:hypothetical protein
VAVVGMEVEEDEGEELPPHAARARTSGRISR